MKYLLAVFALLALTVVCLAEPAKEEGDGGPSSSMERKKRSLDQGSLSDLNGILGFEEGEQHLREKRSAEEGEEEEEEGEQAREKRSAEEGEHEEGDGEEAREKRSAEEGEHEEEAEEVHDRSKRSTGNEGDENDEGGAGSNERKKRSAEEIAREKRETKLHDGSAIVRELADEMPLKRRKRNIVYRDHDTEMTLEEHERWKREAGNGETPSTYNDDPEVKK